MTPVPALSHESELFVYMFESAAASVASAVILWPVIDLVARMQDDGAT